MQYKLARMLVAGSIFLAYVNLFYSVYQNIIFVIGASTRSPLRGRYTVSHTPSYFEPS